MRLDRLTALALIWTGIVEALLYVEWLRGEWMSTHCFYGVDPAAPPIYINQTTGKFIFPHISPPPLYVTHYSDIVILFVIVGMVLSTLVTWRLKSWVNLSLTSFLPSLFTLSLTYLFLPYTWSAVLVPVSSLLLSRVRSRYSPLVMLEGADLLESSYLWIREGPRVEANPILYPILDHYSLALPLAVTIKLVIVVTVILGLEYLRKFNPRGSTYILVGVTLFQAFVNVNNLLALLSYSGWRV
ncbi:hypothetical protein [Metallosphaera hakonensis]|uniref:DUF63 domain-containing protein n=1 Tax=Metallosphaera hakonensis JCM 8857 = DSM 7519 TaxID=1293036 RepID=A0A2U9ITL0_9CREN|nr:hypothetical protein [Metallosphaera hakonensis]AWR99364.1 hypothetical protein DFR87_06200 [Metallosphaera hakonensis JCM 8857 = DSM 7519]